MFFPHSRWINRIGLAITLLTAGIVLADRLGRVPWMSPVATALYAWVLGVTGFALLLGIVSLLWVHIRRILHGEPEWPLSLLLLVAFGGVFVVGMLGAAGTTTPLMEWIFDAFIAPGQATLFALTALFLLSAAYRYLRLDRAGATWIFTGALLAFAVQTPLTLAFMPPILVNLADWLLTWPIMAALRGALLGGALAAMLVGVRLLAQSGNPAP